MRLKTMIAGSALLLMIGGISDAAVTADTQMGSCGMSANSSCGMSAKTDAPATTQPAADDAKYVCPMHSDVTSDKPGKCPKCGMQLKATTKPTQTYGASHQQQQ